MNGPQLRPMTRADLPAVLELEHALFGEEAWSPHLKLLQASMSH